MALKEHRILMIDLLKKEIAANSWLTACSDEEVDGICQMAVRFNRKGFGTEALAYMANAIRGLSDTEDIQVEIADRLVNKCCRVLLVNDVDGGRWNGI